MQVFPRCSCSHGCNCPGCKCASNGGWADTKVVGGSRWSAMTSARFPHGKFLKLPYQLGWGLQSGRPRFDFQIGFHELHSVQYLGDTMTKKVPPKCWLVVEPTHLKNMLVKIGSSSPIFGVNIRNIWNHHVVNQQLNTPQILISPENPKC